LRLGVFAGNTIPSAGGAHTLIETIKKEIALGHGGHEIVFFFQDRDLAEEMERDGIRYVNFSQKGRFVRLKNKCLRRLGIQTANPRLHEKLLSEKIDMIWLLGPYDLDLEIPYIYTVWDLGHRACPVFPELNDKSWPWFERERTYQKMLYRAAAVISGNEAGKKEILENYPMSPGKVRIAPFPIPSFCFEIRGTAEDDPLIQKPFVFYPAQFWAHKNHVALVEAIHILRDTLNTRINCYFVGSDQGNGEYIRKKIAEYGLGDQIKLLGFVEESSLLYLYKNALAMTFVSLLGPNNLPPLEAAALGCPVIISDLPGHLEEMEGAAFPVDGTDYPEIARAIQSLFLDSALREDYVRRGQALAEKYRGYSYFGEILKVIDSLGGALNTWGR
jgi:glycosyltransferase involved in cell wall biosynthesis